MKIGIDVDEVLANFHQGLIKWHNQLYNTSLREKDFNSYFFHEVWGGTAEEACQKVKEFHYSNYFKELAPINQSIDSISYLSQKHNLVIITSRPLFVQEETNKWINYFFKNKFEGIFFSSNHYNKSINSGKTKLDICKELEVAILIDDSSDYIQQCVLGGVKGILFGNYPWNQPKNLPSNICRVKNWKEALERLL